MNKEKIEQITVSVLYVAGEAVSIHTIAALCETDADEFSALLDEIIEKQKNDGAGILICKYGDSVRLGTNPEYSSYIKKLFAPDITEKLSNAVLETLAVIAYRQPVTRAEIESIRGVRCDYTLSMLIEKGMIKEIGRKDVIGRPILYGTSDDFLQHFGLKDVSELPELNLENEITEGELQI